MAVVIETTLGDITVDLFVEERPRACQNFIKLCKLKYYNFNLFHTIERDFIAQTGDPTGVGDGGESVWGVVEGPHKRFFEAESLPKIKHSHPGLLSLVSVGKSMVGSQFFFTLGADLSSLDGVHCVIGEVVEGREVLRKMNETIVDEKFRPYQDIRVTHTVILDDAFSDPRGFQVPSRSPSPSEERMQNGRIGADEDIDDTAGKTMEEIQEMLAEREAKARATILEIVGDLPDADIAPPENVLFVCKLNPVTTDDDLEIIFSRFGKVKSCEVIRDKMSGDSLQYAFVEFEEQQSCEAAYFKMDNVLIDDRRIHVDFSQSVSKIKWRGKGRGVVHADEREKKLDFNNLRGNRGEGRRRTDQRREKDRSRSPQRRQNEGRYDERRQNEGRYNERRRSPNGRGGTYSRKQSHENDRLGRRNGNGREKTDSLERKRLPSPRRRSPLKDHRKPPDTGRYAPLADSDRSYASDRQRQQYERRRSPPSERIQSSNQRQSSSNYSRHSERTGSPERNYNRNDNSHSSKSAKPASRADSNRDSEKKSSNKIVKSKKRPKKKNKKAVSSSSSSSESDSESSSSSSSTSSSSTSEEETRKSKKKSKKRSHKTKKTSKR